MAWDDFHYIRFSKYGGRNYDHNHTLRDADNLYQGLYDMGELALLDLWRAKRHNNYTPLYYRLWRGEDRPKNAWAYLDIDPLGRPQVKFRVDSRLILWEPYSVKKNHVVRFVGFDGISKYRKMLRGIDNRAWRWFRIDYHEKPKEVYANAENSR